MNTNKLTEAQIIRIVENGYLGAPNRQGKQKDYSVFKAEIDARLWAIQDRKYSAQFKARENDLKTFLSEKSIELPAVTKTVRTPFKRGIRWDLIGQKCMEQVRGNNGR